MQHPAGGYIFIVTYGRSGSTVLQTVLQSIDGYHIKGENNLLLQPIYQAYQQARETRFIHGKKDHAPDHPWYGAHQVDPIRFAQRLCDVFIKEILQPEPSARVVGFKEIRFHQVGESQFENFLNFITEMFPGTRFIFNHRNWQDVSRSSWWKTMAPAKVQQHVESCDRMFTAYAEKYPAISYRTQYEDFKDSPAMFEGLFEFLGEAFDLEVTARVMGKDLRHCK